MSGDYRAAVGIVLTNKTGQVLVARRNDMEDQWQFPQGGIDAGEEPTEAMYREMLEEVNVPNSHATVLAHTVAELKYDYPLTIGEEGNRKRAYAGQSMVFYLLRFMGMDSMIDVEAVEEPEFDKWKWVDYWAPVAMIVDFKRDMYRRALTELRPHLRIGGE